METKKHIPNPERGRYYMKIFEKMVMEKRAWEESLKTKDMKALLKKSVPFERII